MARRIPLEGRIAAITDVFDALTSDRVYRRAWPLDGALAEMRIRRSSHINPDLFDQFMKAIPEVVHIRDEFVDGAPHDEGPLPNGVIIPALAACPAEAADAGGALSGTQSDHVVRVFPVGVWSVSQHPMAARGKR